MASLKTYHAKRDFKKTHEPRGEKKAGKGSAFVIQKHDATRLHYDLRLELDGVMLSWAVTKGPSLVPGDKRLAIHVEDHPIAYNKFEGTIPKGEYGGGTVMIWDRGKWFPEGDPHRGMQKGHLDFTLDGEKLHGRWHLVRMRKRPNERQEPWLLIKSDDEFARGANDPDILEQKPKSVVSGRNISQIASANERVWHSNRSADDQPQAKSRGRKVTEGRKAKPSARARVRKSKSTKAEKKSSAQKKSKKRRRKPVDLSSVQGARKHKIADFVPPCLATLSAAVPEGGDWINEIKFDGYRIQAHVDRGKVKLFTRNGLDWTKRFEPVADALQGLPMQSAVLDGEIVVEEKRGIPSFSALQESLKSGRGDFIYYLFDLLHLDDYDLTGAPLRERKRLLEELLSGEEKNGSLRFSQNFTSDGEILLRHACQMHLEGIIVKKADAPYRSGRGGDWLKVKCQSNQEFVIAGYEPSATQSRSIRALILAYYEKSGLRYAGRVGTGFTMKTERELVEKLAKLRTTKSHFKEIPQEERRRKVVWVKPALVAEIDFRGWTHGDVLRQASFKGLREDKKAAEVVREKEIMKTAAARNASPKKSSAKMATGLRHKILARQKSPSYSGVTLTHPDRIYWEDAGVTKQDLAEYYTRIWDRMAPHLLDRPLALLRCPEGANAAKCFFQKHASAGLDASRFKTVKLKGEQPMIAVEDLAGLIALVQAGVLEIHVWGTVADAVDTCNRLVFDLDPGPGVSFKQLIAGARDVKLRLEKLKLKTFLKTTGGKGLHVVVPIAPADWDQAKDFAHGIADAMEAEHPDRYVATMAKKLREHRIFIDYLRNGRGATAIAPYSTRARPGATVSVPIRWEELAKLKAPNMFTVQNLSKWLKGRRDPWAGIGTIKQRLPDLKSRKRA